MIEVDDLSFAYPGRPPVIERLSWRVGRGEAWAVIGPSGCGKTTLLHLLAGLRRPAAGSVRIDGARIDRPRPGTGLVLQEHGLLPWATVAENARLGLRIRGFYGPDGTHAPHGSAGEDRTGHWLRRLGIEGLADQLPAQLSGGQRQRTAIARTLTLAPDLLLVDEPFSALDAPTREDLQDLVADLRREEGLTLVAVTHAIEEAVFLGESILLLGRPGRAAATIANPGAGAAGWRGSAGFRERCAGVREALERAS